MGHLRNSLEAGAPTTMISPSIARIAATEARDWSFVDSWIASQFPGRPHQQAPPPFERNPDTLRALLVLIAFHDTASEEARLLARIERDALTELSSLDGGGGADSAASATTACPATLRDSLLDIVQQELPKEGRVALHSMASMAVAAKIALPEPEELAAAVLDTQCAIFEAEQMTSRAEVLERHIHSEVEHASSVLSEMQGEAWSAPEGLGKRNLELQRTVKAMTAQVPEFENSVASPKSPDASSDFTVHDILRQEQDYLALVENRKELEKRILVFRGLPSDPDLARNELNAYRKELQGITSRRDAAFQGLVGRETPVKRR
ncbi:hypothetical protein ISF_00678 [Cordyceps fumosorosea ARSEF 2679]|uniref:Uncharacterized protein n=1 Tax=Cordyceps fumosorosea (strain ARSEF 2679) TaxID=1081104 RepID=A0A168EGG2_CORFA|nr:hypothetical protein ISF_00678 [Cordyceps fumosorosea ARSEF 2679]OAA73777.1 hypothetical protein ISF_00678 [Cordyceps fumosorosea ARSEF 2679]